MTNRHEPDPSFVQGLEWQLGRELRRRRPKTPRRRVPRNLKLAGLMLVSVAVGAAAMAASQQLQSSWRQELLETRLEVKLQQARQRLMSQLDAIGLTRKEVEQGSRTDRDLIYFELQITQAEADAKILELELEEVESSGREPRDELSAPLVDGRDFVRERIEARMMVAQHRLEVARQAGARLAQRVEVGVVSADELKAQDLLAMEAELQLDALDRQLDLRAEFLDEEISAVEAELMALEAEARSRVIQSDERIRYFQAEIDRHRERVDAGVIHPAAVAEMSTRLAEAEAELRLALEEQRIVRDELDERRQQR